MPGRGFTIVELLIVVVVIGILASVTAVAYGGVTQRAENTKTVSAVSMYAKALRGYAATNGNYPVTGMGAIYCLGAPGGGTCGNTTDAVVGACGGNSAPATTNATFETAIRTIISPLPTTSTQSLLCAGKRFVGAHYMKVNDTATAYFTYYLRGDQTCGGIGSLTNFAKYYEAGVTVCGAELPPLS